MRFLDQKVLQFQPRGRAGMTLVEVVIALAIAVLMVAGIVEGYIFCMHSTVKDSLYMAANARAMERLEETRNAIWAPYRAQPVDELLTNNFPDTNVVLDLYASSLTPMYATLHTEISQILPSSSLPLASPVKRVHVDCIWQFQEEFQEIEITNSIETCRAPDQ
jgi:hypothetical protein